MGLLVIMAFFVTGAHQTHEQAEYIIRIFPPKTEKSDAALWEAMDNLAALEPTYMTVTYGAGGSTRDGTLATLKKAREAYGIPLASHLTFINTTKDELYALVDELWKEDIKHLVALRGDMPGDLEWPLENDPNYFQYTSDFVEGLVARHPFEISVGCYPEKHPDALYGSRFAGAEAEM